MAKNIMAGEKHQRRRQWHHHGAQYQQQYMAQRINNGGSVWAKAISNERMKAK